jgi:uncharacterized protein YgiM (DUF1202 family)
LPIKATAAVVAVALLVGVGSAVGSIFNRPDSNLASVAQRMAAGPKSSEDAQLMRVQLDNVLTKYLEDHGHLPAADLLTKLQSELPSSAFEVLVFDLPNSLKLVEVACVMQPSDYLVVPAKSGAPGAKVSRISGLSVFDGARLVKSGSESSLILLGHTTGDGPQMPQLKAVAVGPEGEITDKTDRAFPVIRGNGTGAFVGTTSNIKIDRMLVSAAKEYALFAGEIPFKDEPFSTTLTWKGDRYKASGSLGTSEFSSLYAVAASLVTPAEVETYGMYLSSDVKETVKGLAGKPVAAPGSFKILKGQKETSRRRRGRRGDSESSRSYILATRDRAFDVILIKSGRWSVTGLKETAVPAESTTLAVKQEAPAPDATVETPEAKIVVKTKEGTSKPVEAAAQVASVPRQEERKPQPEPRVKRAKDTERERMRSESARDAASGSYGKGKIVTETSSSVTMRTGPGRRHRSVVNIPRGTSVRILSEENGWYKISAGGQTGYVYNGYVNKGKAQTSPESEKVATREKPSRSRRSQKTERVASASKEKDNKNSKYRSQISSRKAHSVDHQSNVDQGQEPDFVP